MAVFNPIVITNAGQEILSQAIGGQGVLTFTQVSTSDTEILESTDVIKGMTELAGIKQTVSPISAILADNTIQVSALFSIKDILQTLWGYTQNWGLQSKYCLRSLLRRHQI